MILLSPAKSLDMNRRIATNKTTTPEFTQETAELVKIMQGKSVSDIKSMMSISDKLAELNHARFQSFSANFTPDNSSPALAAFDGDVYSGLDAETLSATELEYAQKNLRILSGLYGLLRPLDLMQPYRLEMGKKLASPRGEDLYDFWGTKLAEKINATANGLVINLASNEYFKAAKAKAITLPIITPQFKEQRDGRLKIISFYAKKARGTMARWILQNKIETADDLREFAQDGYRFDSANDKKGELLFVRSLGV